MSLSPTEPSSGGAPVPWVLSSISRVPLVGNLPERLRVGSRSLTLLRAWPRSRERLALEYSDEAGRRIAGQWLDPGHGIERLRRLARRTAQAAPETPVVAIEALGLLLQADGADRRLPALAPVVALPGATLVVHRPERRAVVRLTKAVPGLSVRLPAFAKLVKPGRSRTVAAAGAV
ncbi:MAG: hypothetical protein ACRDVM_09355, partial [Acidimicrobiia bacterium]